MKPKVFLSDSNGTLTNARQPITGEFAEVIVEFAKKFKFVVVTGSPWDYISPLMPKELLENPNVDFWCNMGNTLYRGGELVFDADNVIDFYFFEPILKDLLTACPHQFHTSFPRHFEVNRHSINFTMLGRPEEGEPSKEIREEYAAWDAEHGQRLWIIDFLNKLYPDYDMSLGGQISVDIVKKGCDKAQVVNYYKDEYDITFLGDRISKHGNDNTIAHVIADIGGSIYSVDDPEETLEVLKSLMELDEKLKA
ncbi:MAG: hypothetical protein IJH75_01435 [Mogibacterium sp.]|nr:hypothetical protein [Mogibacterium sp.]